MVRSSRCRRGERNKGAYPSTTASNPITPTPCPQPPSTGPASWGMAILFKGASATREHGKGRTTGVLRHGLSSLASINSRELNERMRSASTYDQPALQPLTPPLRLPLLFQNVSSLSEPWAHFWGLVGFLIKAAAVTPTPRMHDIVRGILPKNHPSLIVAAAVRGLFLGTGLFNNRRSIVSRCYLSSYCPPALILRTISMLLFFHRE